MHILTKRGGKIHCCGNHMDYKTPKHPALHLSSFPKQLLKSVIFYTLRAKMLTKDAYFD